ncbi:hypothetical protein ACS0TY_010224 [Phlomoides rotata]
MGNVRWHELFPNARLLNLVAPTSDHNQIMLDNSPITFAVKNYQFRFENKWLEQKDIGTVIQKSWDGFVDCDILPRLSATAGILFSWGRHIQTGFKENKRS